MKKRRVNPSARQLRDEQLKKDILRVWEDRKKGRGIYGARKVWRQLKHEGVAVAKSTVERLMRDLGIRGAAGRSRKPRTTVADPAAPRPADLLARNFRAPAPNKRWVADITYVETSSGFVYTAFVTDLFSRAIVGWQVDDNMRAGLALDALEMAIWSRRDYLARDLVHHSDRGVQYTSLAYTQRLEEISAVRSVGRRGDSYDNAAAESVNSLYKKELISIEGPWRDAGDVTVATADWVHWYNNRRIHSACGNISPFEYENNWLMENRDATIEPEAQAS